MRFAPPELQLSPSAVSSFWQKGDGNRDDSQVTCPSQFPPIVILPGFGNDAVDYTAPKLKPTEGDGEAERMPSPDNTPVELNRKGDRDLEELTSDSFVAVLKKRGFDVTVVDVKRLEWLKVAFEILGPRLYTKSVLPFGPGFGWYLQRLRSAIRSALEVRRERLRQEGREAVTGVDDRVILVGHSAGGWLARAALGDGEMWSDSGKVSERNMSLFDRFLLGLARLLGLLDTEKTGEGSGAAAPSCRSRNPDVVAGLVTLGTPQSPPSLGDVSDMTFGALSWTDQNFPGSFLKGKTGIWYLTVAGKAVQGESEAPKGSASRFAYGSYRVVLGEGEGVWGDGVVPVEKAHLQGATQLTLEGVFHSINAPLRWYGSDAFVDCWLKEAVRLFEEQRVEAARDEKSKCSV
uniref:Uncharacterized protein n=1 Tax=Chromera velia CCMP2878 TaxID=1169474 RepID=A0A0G4HYV6_9ALVE|eukprot:Cvel_9574.t1-p1 / transcript=Cvel_9574.t1 / gene=Cvel_9574 / organism=Chromera_velia_CCMP2878 / gene_product=hypothetical protein / transcript_product=hypothetical protein / location=Cvel_scaffold555:30632-31843(+) / protein_length=404 / sequence_SO=supercontig / SO=protein_coding / is_pseudo=false